jgi:hypothetical protein
MKTYVHLWRHHANRLIMAPSARIDMRGSDGASGNINGGAGGGGSGGSVLIQCGARDGLNGFTPHQVLFQPIEEHARSNLITFAPGSIWPTATLISIVSAQTTIETSLNPNRKHHS